MKKLIIKKKYFDRFGIWFIKISLKGMSNKKLIGIKEMVNSKDSDLTPKQKKDLNYHIKNMYKKRGLIFEE